MQHGKTALLLAAALLCSTARAQDGPGPLPPAQKPTERTKPKLELITKRDLPPKEFPGDTEISLYIHNAAKHEAVEPSADIRFLDKDGGVVHSRRIRLWKTIDAGAKDKFEILVPDVPEYVSFEVGFLSQVVAIHCKPGKITEEEKVEVGEVRMVRFSDGSVRMTGKWRNGLPSVIDKLILTFRLAGITRNLEIPGCVKPGTSRDFTFWVLGCPHVETYTYSLNYGIPAEPEDESFPREPTVKRTEHEGGEAEDERRRGPVPGTEIPYIMFVEFLGSTWVGEVVFLKVQFDSTRGPVKPEGKFEFTIFEGDRRVGTVARRIRKSSWKQDAGKLTVRSATEGTVAYDSDNRVLWVGIVRSPRQFNMRLDATLTVRQVGKWEWKGVDYPHTAAKRGPSERYKKKK
ncbi:MAG: hypothetical protein ACYTAF_09240 [Planctomycetota bacterium]|jgi:hypothetical protein